MGDSGTNLDLDVLDYDDDEPQQLIGGPAEKFGAPPKSPLGSPHIQNSPLRESPHRDDNHEDEDGEISSDDGEIKSDAEDGEISDSESDGEVFDKPDEPSIFPKKLEKPVVKEPPVRERPLCRYYKQGFCQFGNRCHFLHSRPNMVNINPEAPERLDTGKYEMFTAQEHPKPPPRKVTPYAAGSAHIGLHRPPPPKPTGETAWEKGIQQAKRMRQVRDQIKSGELPKNHVDQNQPSQNGNKNAAGRTIALISKSKRARIQRIEDTAPTETIDITQEIESYEKVRKPKKESKAARWDQSSDFIDEEKRIRSQKRSRRASESTQSDSSSSSSSSSSNGSSDESISSESSGRKTPKAFRRNGSSQRRSTSEDEDYRRTKRLEAKAKELSRKSRDAERKRSKKKSEKRRRARSTSSSSSNSSDSSESSAHSSRSEKKRMKLQRQLKQVEAALRMKKTKTRRK